MLPVVLLTGAGGLIGQHVMRRLEGLSSIQLFGLVRRPSTKPCVKHIIVDLSDANACETLEDISPAVIIHTAAMLPRSLDDEIAAATNARIDTHIVNLAKACGSSIIFISSSSVYVNSDLPWVETINIGPLPAYAASKLAMEQELRHLLSSAILRISSPYSAVDDRRQSVLYNFVRQAVADQELKVSGAGDRTQDFIHAQDVGTAVRLALLQMLQPGAPSFSGPFNIVSGSPISMLALAEKIVSICGAGRVVTSDPNTQIDPYRAELSRERARDELNWEPEVPIERGIAQLARRMRGGNEDWLAV